MQTNSKYSEIEISNIEVIKFLDIASCYIILAVIMAKTEKNRLAWKAAAVMEFFIVGNEQSFCVR